MNNELFDEAALIHRLKAGDQDAFLLLYDKYHAGLYTYILKFLKVPAFAEDVLQDVFLKLWEIRAQVNPDLCFSAYLYRISRNKVFKLIKKIATDKQLTLQVMDELNRSVQGADIQLQWQEYETLLRAAIDQLPPQRQKVFTLCRHYGRRYDEVASELNISRNTVKEHMVLAVRSIKAYLFRYSGIQLSIIFLLIPALHFNR